MVAEIAALKLALYIAGGLITVLITIIGFFIARIVSDVKDNTQSIGKLEGEIELVSQRQEQDMQRIEETTQLELRQLTKEVSGLTTSVQALVEIQMKKD